MRRLGRFGVVALTAVLAGLCGCDAMEPRTTSPFSNKPVTSSELQAEAARYDAEQRAKDAAEQAEAERELRKLRSEASIEARRLSTSSEMSLAELQARTDVAVQDVVERAAAATAARDAEIDAMQAGIDQALERLKRQQEQRAAIWRAVQAIPGAQAVPGFGIVEGLVTTLLAGGVGAGAVQLTKRGLRMRAETAETRLATTQTTLAETETAAERVIDSIDVLQEASPAVAAALREHKALIDEWQGLAGKALVDRLQRGEKKAA